MPFNLLSKDQLLELRAYTLMRDFEKTDRILSGKDVQVQFAPKNPNAASPVAWTEPQMATYGTSELRYMINLSAEALGDLSDIDSVIMATGANYHELSHVLYTYATTEPTFAQILESVNRRTKMVDVYTIKWAWNLLEDQRIERKFIKRYANTHHYFVAMANKHLLGAINDPTARESIFPLVASRRYIDKDVRETLRVEYASGIARSAGLHGAIGQATAEALTLEMAKVIEKYASTVTFRTAAEAADLIVRFLDLLIDTGTSSMGDVMQQEVLFHKAAPGTAGPPPVPLAKSDGSPTKVSESDDDASARADDDADDDADDADDDSTDGQGASGGGDEESDDDAGGSKPGDDDDDEDAEGGEESTNGNGSGESSSSAEGDDDDSDSNGTSTGGDSKTLHYNDLQKRLWDDYNGGVSENTVQREAQRRMSIVRTNRAAGARRLDSLGCGHQVKGANNYRIAETIIPQPTTRGVANRMVSQFKRIVAEQDPGRLTHRSSGQVSMKRAMTGDFDPETAFDQWDEGNIDTASIEVVMLLDASYSMNSVINTVSESFWAVKRALEQASNEISVSVICFSDGAFYLEQPGTKSSAMRGPRLPTVGGTVPNAALEEARRIFGTTQKKKGLLLCFTDGLWGNANACNEMVKEIRSAGVVTGLAFYANHWDSVCTYAGVDQVPLTKNNYFKVLEKMRAGDNLWNGTVGDMSAAERSRLTHNLRLDQLTESDKDLMWSAIMHNFQISMGLTSPSDFVNFAKAIAEDLIAATTK